MYLPLFKFRAWLPSKRKLPWVLLLYPISDISAMRHVPNTILYSFHVRGRQPAEPLDSLINISPKVLTKVNTSRGHRPSLCPSHLFIKGTGLKLIAQITAFTVLLRSVVAAKCEGGQKFAELVSINLSTTHLEP